MLVSTSSSGFEGEEEDERGTYHVDAIRKGKEIVRSPLGMPRRRRAA